jgi:hypothetical protein
MGQAMTDAMRSAQPGAGSSGSADAMSTLEKLHDLMTKGVLTRDEFEAKKAELLKKIT